MRLNLQSDYALRVLTHLDVRRGELVTIKEIADRFRISQNHLMKVAYLLGREGFIETVRGRSGGLRLIRRSDTIRIGDVVRSMENDLALVECFPGGANGCLIVRACRLKGILHEALEAFLSVLDRYTIADLTAGNTKLRAMLQSEVA
ncbi:MAG: Rrf2 family transcriptional regulator [Hyphomonadaceae bacterium]|jgi:Rrf2 family transcriptional regulator, nitric oxide-sensitive transcriptional repressor|nr:Rrf2 family transcriptional regulator [Hyphomonadaceae bacterium]HPI47461.1 Rrf2 family transcriptional regulator [Hyphomonadaceae bacterium]